MKNPYISARNRFVSACLVILFGIGVGIVLYGGLLIMSKGGHFVRKDYEMTLVTFAMFLFSLRVGIFLVSCRRGIGVMGFVGRLLAGAVVSIVVFFVLCMFFTESYIPGEQIMIISAIVWGLLAVIEPVVAIICLPSLFRKLKRAQSYKAEIIRNRGRRMMSGNYSSNGAGVSDLFSKSRGSSYDSYDSFFDSDSKKSYYNSYTSDDYSSSNSYYDSYSDDNYYSYESYKESESYYTSADSYAIYESYYTG